MNAQDAEAMLGAMRELPVVAGDAVFVPAGAPHAIGEGILMVEVQEPTDLSVLLEWDGFELSEDEGHLDLGWDTALGALDRSAWDEARVEALRGPGAGRSMLPPAADAWFRAERVRGGDELDAGFSHPRRARGQRRARRRAVRGAGRRCSCPRRGPPDGLRETSRRSAAARPRRRSARARALAGVGRRRVLPERRLASSRLSAPGGPAAAAP